MTVTLSEIADCLRELVALVEDARQGEYEIDSFTTQPARQALAALDAMNPESTHVQFADAATVWQSRPLDTSGGGSPFVKLNEAQQPETTEAENGALHNPNCLACRGICVNCTHLTHSREDGAAYCKANHGWWITAMLYECEWFKPDQFAAALDKHSGHVVE